MSDIAFIEAHVTKLLEQVAKTQTKKEEKENQTDHDENIISALEQFHGAVEDALEELKGVYEEE